MEWEDAQAASFSQPVAALLAALALMTNAVKAYTGVGGGMLFVCLVKVLDSLGLMGVETGNNNLGGLAGTCAMVTVMDGVTSFPLVIYDRAHTHWPIVLPYMFATLSTLPIGVSILSQVIRTVSSEFNRVRRRYLMEICAIKRQSATWTTRHSRSNSSALLACCSFSSSACFWESNGTRNAGQGLRRIREKLLSPSPAHCLRLKKVLHTDDPCRTWRLTKRLAATPTKRLAATRGSRCITMKQPRRMGESAAANARGVASKCKGLWAALPTLFAMRGCAPHARESAQ